LHFSFVHSPINPPVRSVEGVFFICCFCLARPLIPSRFCQLLFLNLLTPFVVRAGRPNASFLCAGINLLAPHFVYTLCLVSSHQRCTFPSPLFFFPIKKRPFFVTIFTVSPLPPFFPFVECLLFLWKCCLGCFASVLIFFARLSVFCCTPTGGHLTSPSYYPLPKPPCLFSPIPVSNIGFFFTHSDLNDFFPPMPSVLVPPPTSCVRFFITIYGIFYPVLFPLVLFRVDGYLRSCPFSW